MKKRELCYENLRRTKVYIGSSSLVPLRGGAGFSEPVGAVRIPVRPFRYQPLPMLIPHHGDAVAWGVFERAKGGEPIEVLFRPGYEPQESTIVGPDGRPAR